MSASDAFVLLPADIRVSRNARAQWYIRNINVALSGNTSDDHDASEAEDEATDGEDDGVSPAAASAGALMQPVGVLGEGNTVTEDTKIWFLAQR